MKKNLICIATLAMMLEGCASISNEPTAPSSLELELSNNINQFISKIESNNTIREVNNKNITYLKYYENSNAVGGMHDSLTKLCENRYDAKINETQDVNLHEYGGSVLHLNQAVDAAKQWIDRKYEKSGVLGSNVTAGQCVRYRGEAEIAELPYAYQIITDGEVKKDGVVPVHLMVMKGDYFSPIIEEALANEPETYKQRKVRMLKDAATAKELARIEKIKQDRIKQMAAFVNGRGKQVCKEIPISNKLVQYEIKRKASIIGFVEDNTNTRIQVRITGHRVDNKNPQDILVSDEFEYKGSKVITGNIIWDNPLGWYFCSK